MSGKKNFFKFVLLAGDIVLLYLALVLALAIRSGNFAFLTVPKFNLFLFHFSIIHLVWFFFLFLLDFYEIPPIKKIFDFIFHLIMFSFLAATTAITYFYFKPKVPLAPKTILILDVLIAAFLLAVWRYLFKQILKFRNFKEKIVIIGFRPGLAELVREHLFPIAGYEILAFFNPNPSFSNELAPFAKFAKYGIVSDIHKLREIIEKEEASIVVFPKYLQENGKLIRQLFSNLPLKINYISFAQFYESLAKKVPIDSVDETWFLENISRGERKIEDTLKKGFDVIFSIIGLFITIILFPFISLIIKIDSPGTILYKQKRAGKNDKSFTLYKFRTMKLNAEKNGPQWASTNDTRITRVGKILRKLHLDEFPQFFNILKGDISFVGPRPERPEFVIRLKEEIPYYNIRHLIKPGFTGWAQINYHYGASIGEAKEKFQYDLYYIKNRSFLLDLEIILKTLRIIFKHK